MNRVFKRKSLRLKNYDYSSEGSYFVTISTQDRKCLFWEGEAYEPVLNEAGGMIQKVWEELPSRFPSCELDQFVVMPNHIHGIIVIVGAPLLVGARDVSGVIKKAGTRPAPTLADIIRAFKSITTREYIQGVKGKRWPSFNRKLWQRNYYEHIIRSEEELMEIRRYVVENPLKGHLDSENPAVGAPLLVGARMYPMSLRRRAQGPPLQ